MQTTLNKIKSHSPCGLSQPKDIQKGWGKLLLHLNKTEADDEVLELRTILESNGLSDTIWAMRAVEGKDKEIRLFAADCAELVLHIFEKEYPNDDRPRKAIQAARDYANGLINAEELIAAAFAASAAWAAASAATAAGAAAVWAAEAAAWDALHAARSARAVWDAKAAWYAWDAARVARAVWAAKAAWDAARDARDALHAAGAAADAAEVEIKSLLLKYI